MTPETAPPITLFICGPSKCEHDYSGWQEFTDRYGATVGTAVCVKCGATAFEEGHWL